MLDHTLATRKLLGPLMPKSKKDLIKQIRETVAEDRVLVPGRSRRNANWPICLTCGREPHCVQLEDISRFKVEIRVKCTHMVNPPPEAPDFEDSITVDIPIGTERDEHIGMALRSGRFFDPTRPPK